MTIDVIGEGVLAMTTREACRQVGHGLVGIPDVTWVCEDMGVTPTGRPDVADWRGRVERAFAERRPPTRVLVSTPVPVGTIRALEAWSPWPARWASSPENIRLAHALPDFLEQDRILLGRRDDQDDSFWGDLLLPFTAHLIFTDPETAEVAKHALNTYLALMIVFGNEIGRLAQALGATGSLVTEALRAERRVSRLAPLVEGSPYGGGNLARDLGVLVDVARQRGVPIPLIDRIHDSNEVTRHWRIRHS